MCLMKATVSHMFPFVQNSSSFGICGGSVMQAINPYHCVVPTSPQIKSIVWLKMGTNRQMSKTNVSFKALKLAIYFQAYFFWKKMDEQKKQSFSHEQR